MSEARPGFPRRSIVLPLFAAAITVLLLVLPDRLGGLFGKPGGLPGADGMAATAPATLFVPAAAHASGANGASWRTDLEVHNPGTTAASFVVKLLPRDSDNTASPTKTYTLAARQSRRFTDVLLTEFAFNGAAALRISLTSGSLLATSRTYNLLGGNPWNLPQGASFSQFVPGVEEGDAIAYGQEGRLIHLTQQPSATLNGFRTNLGIVNATASPIDVTVDLYRASGAFLGKKQGAETRLPAYGFRQLNEVLGAWGTVADGYAVVKTTTPGGKLFAFATVIDNHNSGDPVFVPAAVLTSTAGPTPTPTRTPTRTPTPPAGGLPNLYLFRPAAWPACLVVHSASGCCTTSACCTPSPVSGGSAFLQIFLANSGTATLTGPVRLSLTIDGAVAGYASWANASGLEPGFGVVLTWEHTGAVTPGTHQLRLTIDPDNTIAETNEADNVCTATATWLGAPLLYEGDPPGESGPEASLGASLPERVGEAPLQRAALAATGPIYVPASAHASGVNGASWRTDLEVHNPGATAAAYTVTLLRQGQNNGSGAPVKSFSLGPQQSVRYADVLSSVFGYTGAAALRIATTAGSVLANSRTYNLIGANTVGLPVGASFGQYVPGLAESEAIGAGQEGRIIQLSHRDPGTLNGFRSNIGYVSTTGTAIELRIDLYRSDGTLLGTIQDERTRLAPYGFGQINAVFGAWGSAIDEGYAVVRAVTAGARFFAFATVIDNHLTGDPVFVPATRLAATALPGTPTPTPTATPGTGVITGPGGTTVTLPLGATTSGATVTLVAGSGSTLAKSGETLVSTVVKTNVSGTGVAIGNGSFKVTLPVSGTVSDPEKLLLKVAVSTGRVYPVAGVYDTAKKTFSAELMRVWDGWTMGVVTRPSLAITSTAPLGPGGASALGWVTPTDWQTCAFRVFDTAASASAAFKTGVPAAMKKACDHLRGAEFRSPRLWVDGRWNPKARAVHLVQGTGPNDPTTSFGYTLDDAAFSMAGYTDAQMQSLGQIYFNWDEWSTVVQPRGWSYEHVAIHELFHAVQVGYDFRDRWAQSGNTFKHTAMGIMEGTATLVGQVFQSNPNGIYGGEVTVRSPVPPARLALPVMWNEGIEAYARQDFFAYVAKRWSGGNLRDLRWLFQHLSDQTEGQFGKPDNEYFTLYRRAMDFHYQNALGTTLPEVYAEYAVDRAYMHTTPALLRPADSALRTSSLDPSLFMSVPAWDADKAAPLEVGNIWPLETRAVRIPVSDAARTAKKVTMDVAVKGAKLERQGLRIFVYPEKDGVLEIGTQMELTDVSKAVEVPVAATTTSLTVLIVNGSVPHDVANVTFSKERLTRLSEGDTIIHYCEPEPIGCSGGSTCIVESHGDEFVSPLVWSGNRFKFTYLGVEFGHQYFASFEGELSADRKTLLWYKNDLTSQSATYEEHSHWVNLPLDPVRSVSGRLVFAVAGEAARPHIVREEGCGQEHPIVNYNEPLKLEVWLAP
jgi:hypothetical protein